MDNLNKYTKNALWAVAAFILLGVAGRCDRDEQVIYNMPDIVYHSIKRNWATRPTAGSLMNI